MTHTIDYGYDAGGEVVEAADAGAEFAETGFDRVPPPAEDLGVAWFASQYCRIISA